MNSITSTEDFDTLSNITLANPHGMQGGAYFSKLTISGKPLLIQTPKCSTKNGIHMTDKKTYCDLMFTENNHEFLGWIEELQSTVKQLIYEKRDLWFHNEMDLDSIDYHWQNALRVYKQKKTLLRCFLPKKRGLHSKYSIQIFDEDENQLSVNDITKETSIISILEISGLKFTSQSFQLECTIRQMMTVKEEEIFSKCLIQLKKPDKLKLTNENNSSQSDRKDQQDDHSDTSSSDDSLLYDKEAAEESSEESAEEATEAAAEEATESATEAAAEEAVTNCEADVESNQSSTIDNNTQQEEQSDNTQDITNIPETSTEKPLEKVTLTLTDLESTSPPPSTSAPVNENVEEDSNTNEMENVKQTILKEVTDDILSSLKNQESLEKNLDTVSESLEKTKEISEVNIEFPNIESDSLTLKKPNEVYMEIYKEARKKAKEAKKAAVQAYLEAKRIKSLYLMDEIESSDDDFDINEYTD